MTHENQFVYFNIYGSDEWKIQYTLTHEIVCICDTEEKAIRVINALTLYKNIDDYFRDNPNITQIVIDCEQIQ